ncbi:MAG: FAD binding domain-containing protein [Gammaproteobacteria bacterium]|nr:FAD binding domain-containing protein [Gammaproteobacteria bacterium]MDE0366445.1 FAD binding domain-containing protein [Gammaproteobacteria bacterium]
MIYLEPESVPEAVAALAGDEDARCLAGGQTLMAMMNADLVMPSTLVGLRRIAGLHEVTETEGMLRIGAMVTHARLAGEERLEGARAVVTGSGGGGDDVSISGRLEGARAVVRDAARQIAHPAVRNRGTIGGALCHADPQADLPGALVAAGAHVEIAGADGVRTAPVDGFFVDYLESSLEPGEMLTAVLIPEGPQGAVGAHLKFSRTDGDYAIVSVSSVVAMQDGVCSYARVVVGSAGPAPLHLDAADALLTGSGLDDAVLLQAGDLLAAAADPVDDVRGSSDYRRLLLPALLARAVGAARERFDG